MLDGLGNLKALSLHNNQLKSIQPGAFKDLSNLDTLKLSYNDRLYFFPEVLRNTKQLRELVISLSMKHSLIRNLNHYALSQTPQIKFWLITHR